MIFVMLLPLYYINIGLEMELATKPEPNKEEKLSQSQK